MKITSFDPFIDTKQANDIIKVFEEHGFKNAYGDETVDTNTSKAAMMISPSGFRISIIQHLK